MYRQEELKELEERIGYVFVHKELLYQALTHSSFSNEQKINKYKNSFMKRIRKCLRDR